MQVTMETVLSQIYIPANSIKSRSMCCSIGAQLPTQCFDVQPNCIYYIIAAASVAKCQLHLLVVALLVQWHCMLEVIKGQQEVVEFLLLFQA